MKAKTLLYLLITGLTVFSLLGSAPALVSASQPTQTGGITVCSIPRSSQGVAYKGGSAESTAWGPAALAVGPDGSFWVADPAGNRVLQYSSACKLLRRIPLQRLAVGVNDLEVTANGVYLLDAAASSPKVVRLSLKGVPAGSLPIPAEVRAGLSGLSMTPDGVLLVEQEGGSFTYALTDPSGLPISKEFNPDLRRSTVMDLPSVTEGAASSQAAGQRLIYTLPDSSRMALVERAELVNGVIAVDQTVRLYAPDGEQVGEARVPLADQHTYVANPVAAAPDGQVYVLVTRPTGAEIRRLEFVNDLQPILPQAEPEEVPAQDQPLMGQGASPQAVNTYPQNIIDRANEYLYNSKYLSNAAISGACSGRTIPRYLQGKTAGTYSSVPYDWGGFESVAGFNTAMNNTSLRAGDADTTSTSCGRGVDCSGFVSRTWGLTSKYSTSTLPNISTALGSLGQLQRGDILNLPSSHVVLFNAFAPNGIWGYESTAYNAYDRVVYMFSSWSRLSGYIPRRYVSVGADSCSGQYRAQYFNGKDLYARPAQTRCESWPIHYDWGGGSPMSGIGSDNFSVRWVGRSNFSAGNYTFIATADDGVRVFLDQNLIIDQWKDQAPTEYRVTRYVTSGMHSIQVDYYENGGGAVAKFRWESASSPNPQPTPTLTPAPPVPSSNLAVGKPTWASSYEKSGYESYRGNDGSTSTRWSSMISSTLGDQWWRVDLGGRSYNQVVIRWEAAYAASHFIGWSDDGNSFTGYWYNISSPGSYRYTLGGHSNRYVAVLMRTRAPQMNNYSFYEFEVYNASGTSSLSSESTAAQPSGEPVTIILP